ncbi:hypothetical protein [Streptomyces sp. NPDC005423]|uniref:hypothetical protein n=1 Tax=Streptomyces sp. NPDC005423 TaxID=3155343 RepID=UPI0033A807F7
MGTKTVDEAANEATEVKSDAETVDVAKTDQEVTAKEAGERPEDGTAGTVEEDDVTDEELAAYAAEAARAQEGNPGVGQGAAAVVSAALGFVSLSGGWIGTVAAARETLVGQLRTSSSASVTTQIKEVYGDAWHTTALWAGLFALVAAIVGVVVLVRPAFGTPGRPQATWIKSVAWAGVSLGVLGLLLAVLKYTDILLSLPSAS